MLAAQTREAARICALLICKTVARQVLTSNAGLCHCGSWESPRQHFPEVQDKRGSISAARSSHQLGACLPSSGGENAIWLLAAFQAALWILSRLLPATDLARQLALNKSAGPTITGQCVEWSAGNRLLALTAAGMTLDKLTPIGGLQALHHVPSSPMDSSCDPSNGRISARWATEVLRCARIEEEFVALSIHAIF